MDEVTDLQELLVASIAGDSDARAGLIRQVADRLHNLTRLMLRSDFPRLKRWEETDDVFQNAIIRLDNSLADARPQTLADFYGLATTQVRRTLIDLARHYYGPEGEGANRHSHGEQTDTSYPIAQAATEQSHLSLSLWTRLHEVVESMPTEECEAFSLVWYAGMTQEEAARVAGIARRTLIRRLNRARIIIHREMRGEMPPASVGG